MRPLSVLPIIVRRKAFRVFQRSWFFPSERLDFRHPKLDERLQLQAPPKFELGHWGHKQASLEVFI